MSFDVGLFHVPLAIPNLSASLKAKEKHIFLSHFSRFFVPL